MSKQKCGRVSKFYCTSQTTWLLLSMIKCLGTHDVYLMFGLRQCCGLLCFACHDAVGREDSIVNSCCTITLGTFYLLYVQCCLMLDAPAPRVWKAHICICPFQTPDYVTTSMCIMLPCRVRLIISFWSKCSVYIFSSCVPHASHEWLLLCM